MSEMKKSTKPMCDGKEKNIYQTNSDASRRYRSCGEIQEAVQMKIEERGPNCKAKPKKNYKGT